MFCVYLCMFLPLSYIELLFIHKNRPRLQTEAVLLNSTQEEVLGTNTILEREVQRNVYFFVNVCFDKFFEKNWPLVPLDFDPA